MTTNGGPFGPFSPTGDPEVDEVLKTLNAQSADFEEAGRLLSETVGRGEAEEGRVVVEVRPNGSLTALRIDPRAMRLGSEALAEAILRAAGAAEADAAERAESLMLPLFGEPGTPGPGLYVPPPGTGDPDDSGRRGPGR
ncbi:YbaB/EbfC family nucleoid-associated protein [Sphaerisporangium corydalis]|uniref:YbaB/EbfC family nucleoid-associated protein n=1 Tax=Sphaerisporangium corydalis TaxID=1441875 RepID=A0ABV9E5M9_9ACTN|nr:YbaB/EbfC family nucleoid-associated protein [Sphaerisporangium corydalis]